ncbi:hypothetical protein [Nocardia sp. NPDC047038]|uniref:hypothetical protein n=1 Tax=Nocardia sp. NPDC047038 TaxID=3154338 RepID=UPI0033DA821B
MTDPDAPQLDEVGIAVIADGVLDFLSRPVSIAHREIPVSARWGWWPIYWGPGRRPCSTPRTANLYRAKKAGKDRWALCVLDARALAGADYLADAES